MHRLPRKRHITRAPMPSSMFCNVASNRRIFATLSMAVMFGIMLGVAANYYGWVMENIRVDVAFSSEQSGNTSAEAQRLLAALPKGFKLSDAAKAGSEKHKKYVVPNTVHFIWFGKNKRMNFVHYVSILSAHREQRPDALMLHCDHLPVGVYWEKLWREVPLRIMYREPPEEVHGQKLMHVYHKGDVAKMEILLEYGGIYLDYDVIVLRSMDELRVYDATLGKERPPKFIAGIIAARKNAGFVKLWYESYKKNYRKFDWDFNCARMSYQLYKERPDLLHVEPYKLTTPDWMERRKLWDEVIDWRGMGLYVIHTMTHLNLKDYTENNIKGINSTFGQVMRFIYYGSSELIL